MKNRAQKFSVVACAATLLVTFLPLAMVARAEAPPPAATAEPDDGDIGDDLGALLNEAVVTTASQSAQRTSDAPGVVRSISGAELEKHDLRTMIEVFRYLGLGIYVPANRDLSTLTTPAVSVRGSAPTSGKHLLVLLDGHTMNDHGTGDVPLDEGLGVPLEMVDSIEVMIGPGSVLYGSNAMYGVVNIVTKRAKDFAPFVARFDAGGVGAVDEDGRLTSDGSPGRRLRGSLRGGSAFDLGGVDAGITAGLMVDANGDGSFQLDNPAVFQGHLARTSLVVGGYLTFTYGKLRLGVGGKHSDVASPAYGVPGKPIELSQNRFNVSLGFTADLSETVALSATLSGDLSEGSDRAHVSGAAACRQPIDCDFEGSHHTGSVNLDANLTADWLHDGSLLTLVGTSGRYILDNAHRRMTLYLSETETMTVPTGGFDDSRVSGGLYAQQIWTPAAWFTLNAGLRLDLDQHSGVSLSPRAALNLRANDETTVKLVYAEGFRAPTPSELNDSIPDVIVANPDLAPETVRGLDLVLEANWGEVSLLIGGFMAWYDDIVAYEVVDQATLEALQANGEVSPGVSYGSVVRMSNVGLVTSVGGNVALAYRPTEHLELHLNLTAAHSRMKDASGERAVGVPRLVGNARVSWDVGGSGQVVALAGSLQALRPELDKAYFTPGYETHARPSEHTGSVRLTAGGPIVGGLRYRLTGDYAFGSTVPGILALHGALELMPLGTSRLSFFGVLEWAF